jgi:hypothetical protein
MRHPVDRRLSSIDTIVYVLCYRGYGVMVRAPLAHAVHQEGAHRSNPAQSVCRGQINVRIRPAHSSYGLWPGCRGRAGLTQSRKDIIARVGSDVLPREAAVLAWLERWTGRVKASTTSSRRRTAGWLRRMFSCTKRFSLHANHRLLIRPEWERPPSDTHPLSSSPSSPTS